MPATCPRIQLFGNGFGQYGSTAKRGAPGTLDPSTRCDVDAQPPAPRPIINTSTAIAPRQKIAFIASLRQYSSYPRPARERFTDELLRPGLFEQPYHGGITARSA